MCAEQNAVYVHLILINDSWFGEKKNLGSGFGLCSDDLGSIFKVQSSQSLGIHDIWWHELYTQQNAKS